MLQLFSLLAALAIIVGFAIRLLDFRPDGSTLLRRLGLAITGVAGEMAVKPRSLELRETLEEHGGKLAELRAVPADKRADTYDQDLRNARNMVLTLDAEFQSAQRMEQYDLQRAAFEHALANPEKPEVRGPRAAFVDIDGNEIRTAGATVVESTEFAEWAKGSREYRSFPHIEVRTLLDSTTDGGSPGLLLPQGQPIMPRPRQMRLFVRDLLSVQQTGLASVPYIRELNPTTNETGATAVAEGAPKTEVVMEWESDDAPVRKIAAWIPATMEILADAPTLRGYIDTRLAYMLKLREEQQILNGVGTAPHIKGILQFTTQEQTAVNNDVPATIGLAIGKIENVDGDPDGAVMNPLDFWAQVTTRRSTFFDGQGDGNMPFASPTGGFWGLPTVRTRAVASLAAVVGSWKLGATLFDRMQTTIRTSDSHDDYFVNNKVAILAEERVALAVHRPDFFVDTVLDITA